MLIQTSNLSCYQIIGWAQASMLETDRRPRACSCWWVRYSRISAGEPGCWDAFSFSATKRSCAAAETVCWKLMHVRLRSDAMVEACYKCSFPHARMRARRTGCLHATATQIALSPPHLSGSRVPAFALNQRLHLHAAHRPRSGQVGTFECSRQQRAPRRWTPPAAPAAGRGGAAAAAPAPSAALPTRPRSRGGLRWAAAAAPPAARAPAPGPTAGCAAAAPAPAGRKRHCGQREESVG